MSADIQQDAEPEQEERYAEYLRRMEGENAEIYILRRYLDKFEQETYD